MNIMLNRYPIFDYFFIPFTNIYLSAFKKHCCNRNYSEL